MPVMKGLLAPQNTFLDTIANHFDGTREYILFKGFSLYSTVGTSSLVLWALCIIKIVQSACFKLFLRRYTLFDLTGVAGKYIYLTFEAATLPFESTVAFRGLATCIFVTHFRIVTGTEKCRCCQKCPVVRSNYKIETYNSKPELEMETECAV